MATSRKRRRKAPAFDTFNPFDVFINKIASQYRLGPKGRSLIRETLDLITEQSGGIGGFLDRFKAAGLAAQVASWSGAADPVPLSAQEVEQALGSEVISRIANKAGASQGFVGTVLGKTIPKIIGLLMESGFSDTAIPPSVSSSDEIAQLGPEQIPPKRAAGRSITSPLGRWLVPGTALLITLGVVGYFFVPSRGTGRHVAAASGPVMAQVAPPTPANNQHAPSQIQSGAAAVPNALPVISQAPSIPASLALSNNNGLIVYSGIVGNDAARSAITDSLKAVFGADKITGDLRVDQYAGPADWSKDLRAALDEFRTPGSRARFEGDTVRVGGEIPGAERDRIVSSLKTTLGPKFALAAMVSSAATPMATAADNAAAQTAVASPVAISGPGGKKPIVAPGQAALKLPAIYFATNSVKVLPASKAVLEQVAGLIKQLPRGSMVWISGYPNRASNPTSTIKLSRRRANAVRQVLVDAGVNPSLLIAKVYGSSHPPISNREITEGRSSVATKGQPRVEFCIVQQ